MHNGLLRFNKHILNELAEGLKHLPNLDGVSKGDSLIINEQGNPAWGSAAFIPTFENAAYGIEWTKNDNDVIRIGPYFVPNKVGTNKKADYNSKRGSDGQDTDKAVRVLLLDGWLLTVLWLALVTLLLLGSGRLLVLLSASLPQLSLIK